MATSRLEVLKTYKLYIGGKFPRTESGRYYKLHNENGEVIANMCLASRKDLRNAVSAARSAVGSWAGKSAYNRSQVLYRIAEMLEGRRSQFEEELMDMGASKTEAKKEVETSVDRLIYFAGWCDKYQQIFSSVNPVASSHFNFSMLEPMGVVTAITPSNGALLGLVSVIAPIIAGGNTCVVMASQKLPLCSVTFAEVLNSSDVPGGVVNILTGDANELASHMAGHMDVNALWNCSEENVISNDVQILCVENLKRYRESSADFFTKQEEAQNPYLIEQFQEVKTTWHPIEKIGGASGGY